MSWVNRAIDLALQNVNGILFAVGLALLIAGVREWSPAAANVVAGVVAMAIGVTPYVLRRKKGRG